MKKISAKEMMEMKSGAYRFIDVRTKNESDTVGFDLPEVELIPVLELVDKIHEMPKDIPLVFADFDGTIGFKAANMMSYNGYDNVSYLDGGLKEWNRLGYPLIYHVTDSCEEGGCQSCSGCH